MKNIMKHKEFSVLARREDDLKYVLLTYGHQLGDALAPVQKEFKKAEEACDKLLAKLEKQGYVYFG